MEYRNPKELKSHPVSVALYGDNHIDDLVESIKAYGILVPLTITDKNTIISGHRRWRSALELSMVEVPVEIKTFPDELSEQNAILDFNKQRQKTTMQIYNELQLRKTIHAKQAEQHEKAGKLLDPAQINGQGDRHKRSTDEVVGREMQFGGREKVRQLEKICEVAEEGNEEARNWIEKIDNKDATINKAYTELFASSKAHVSYNTGEYEWYTPKEYIDLARQVLGVIDLDPASAQEANEVIQATQYYDKEIDGLKQEWHGHIWMNPPYSQPFVDYFSTKLVDEYKKQHIIDAIVLVNNATETKWFQTLCSVASAICFPLGRVRFWSPSSNGLAAPLQGQALIYFGNNPDIFLKAFNVKGIITEIKRNPIDTKLEKI